MTLHGRYQTLVAGTGGLGYDPSAIHSAMRPVTELSLVEDVHDVLHRVAAGDGAAFETLYRLVAPALLGFLAPKMGSRDLGEDVLQDAFLLIWRNAARYDPALGTPMAWMITIARNAAVDRLRLNRREAPVSGLSDDLDRPEFIADEDAGPARLSEAKSLMNCPITLDDTPRRAIVQSYCHGYIHDEQAQALGLPLGTVKSAIRRALPRLRACLEP